MDKTVGRRVNGLRILNRRGAHGEAQNKAQKNPPVALGGLANRGSKMVRPWEVAEPVKPPSSGPAHCCAMRLAFSFTWLNVAI
jgi:hypothetical protein